MRPSPFAGAGALQDAYEQVDWGRTPLGPAETWSPTLRAALSLVLATRFPATLMWGEQLVMLYNDAYVPLIADKHPGALGASAPLIFPEVWDTIGPLTDHVMSGAGPVWFEDERVPLSRRGFLEECFFTFSYSPVAGEDGRIEGLLDIVVETTSQVVDRRRLELLQALGDVVRDLDCPASLAEVVLPVLRSCPDELPVVDLVVEGEGLLPAPPAGVPVDGHSLVSADGGSIAWFRLDAAVGDALLLGVRLSEQLAPDEHYLGFLALVADTLAGARSSALGRASDRQAAASSRSMSETLQRSLLTEPPQPDHLQIVARYQPAAADAQIGGDWYDAFLTGVGTTCLVVGDVSGHDQQAAAGMGQVRNLLRGIGYTIGQPPAAVLSALDRAVRDLAVGSLATCLLAQVEQDPEDAGTGLRRLRWSSAGHLPPLLLLPDGGAELLHTEPDLLIGLDPASERLDHTAELPPGSTLLLYTDGLVERRGASLDDGLQWLLDAVRVRSECDLSELCDELLAEVQGHCDDDVVVLAVRLHAEDVPRPPDAGPELLPEDLVEEL